MDQHRSGPRRSAVAREAILAATARTFVEVGYEHLTIEAIAKAAKVGKQTIYRWWPTRGALIADCLVEGYFLDVNLAVPDTGDIRRDLGAWLESIIAQVDGPNGQSLLRSLIAAAAEDKSVGERLNEALGAERLLRERLDVAVAAGQLSADAPVEYIGQALFGTLIVRGLSRTSVEAAPMRMLVERLLG